MHVRPFFWCLLAGVCLGVLIFAATIRTHGPALMQVRLAEPHPVASTITTLELYLTDQEGLPIERAQVVPSAHMTNMDMVTKQVHVVELGQGTYLAQFQLYMAGPWEIRVEAQAPGFDSLHQALLVQVQ